MRKHYPSAPYQRVKPEDDKRRIDLPRPMIQAIAEELVAGKYGYQQIADKAGCGYNQVRTIQRQLKALDVLATAQ